MDIANSQKKSPRSSAKSKRDRAEVEETPRPSQKNFDERPEDKFLDRTPDMVARIRAAKEAARREMESFGDISEYEITTLQGLKQSQSEEVSQTAFDFEPDAKPEVD